MKSSIACLALVAGASAQAVVGTPYRYNPYALATPYNAQVNIAAVAQANGMDVDAIKADWVKTQAAAKAAAAASKSSALKAQEKYYKYLASRSANSAKTTSRYNQWAAQTAYENANTKANKAYDAFVANPSRATSLASEAASANANIKTMSVYAGAGVDDESFGKAGRFNYQAHSAELEAADDALKHASSRLAIDEDSHYFTALDDYNRAESETWKTTFLLQGKTYAAQQIEKANAFADYDKAWTTYAANPSQGTANDLSVAEKGFTADWLGWKAGPSNQRLSKYLKHTAAKQAAAYAKKDAEAIIPDFVARNQPAPAQPSPYYQLAGAYGARFGR